MQEEQLLFFVGDILVMDESMSAWGPQTTTTGGLPNISFVQRKPEPLGIEYEG